MNLNALSNWKFRKSEKGSEVNLISHWFGLYGSCQVCLPCIHDPGVRLEMNFGSLETALYTVVPYGKPHRRNICTKWKAA